MVKDFTSEQSSSFMTKQQVADTYGISTKTLTRHLKDNGINIGRKLISPKEQKIIRELFGDPKRDKNSLNGPK
jgi:carbamoylphosphate synthase small subunit